MPECCLSGSLLVPALPPAALGAAEEESVRAAPTEADEHAILRAIAEGEPGSLEALARLWLPLALGWCRRLAPAGVDGDDAAQEVMRVALRRVGEGLRLANPRGWLFQVTRLTLADLGRRQRRRRWLPWRPTDEAAAGPDPLGEVLLSERGRIVQQVLHRLRPREREVLVLCGCEERSAAEAARILGVDETTARRRLARARRNFALIARRHGLGPAEGGP